MDKIFTPNTKGGDSFLYSQIPPSVHKKLIDAELKKKQLENESEERGWLGKLWGTIEHSSNNIAGLFIVLLLLIGTGYTCCLLFEDSANHSKILEFWGMLSPMLTLALGYLFGRGQNAQS